jgi:PTH1 family peptidyl-tRNA hydrolase
MLIVVGLRNPGSQFARTRHNVGSEVVVAAAERWGVLFKRGPLRIRCDISEAEVRGTKVILGLPRSAMNLSGGPVAALLRYFQVMPGDLLLVHDDIDLPFARLRLHLGRGPGGHNGVESVVEALGTKDFYRLKVGVGRPPGSIDPADFVLRPFSKSEREEVDFLVQDAVDVVDRFVDDREAAVQLAGLRKPPA